MPGPLDGSTRDAAKSVNAAHDFTALVFSKTAGFRHESIEAGVNALKALSIEHQFDLDATEDANIFTDEGLAAYDVIIFLSTTGDILNDDQQAAFERFIRSGRGFVGIHAAADTEYDWPFYGELVGAYFESHPQESNGTIKVVDRAHPSTASMPKEWVRFDEWYNFQTNPRGDVHVLATLDERTYSGGNMGADHPIAWCQVYEGARSWYTGGGHTSESFSEPLFQEHLVNGIEYAAGVIDGACGGTVWDNYEKVVLDDNTLNPMALDVAEDGRVFFVERTGILRVFDPGTNLTSTAGELDVITTNEDGLIGIALDPSFSQNGWIYLFHSPADQEDVQHVSRFTMTGNQLDLSSEDIIIEIPVQRDQCCHSGGAMMFDPDGNLYISTGDNTNPFESNGYTPIDERADRGPWDAQKSSANTQDLRGKILRITPQGDGTYTIPNGNLFTDAQKGRPEIYIMGLRNPFRMSLDEKRGWLYWGDVGPDAGGDDTNRGPQGYDEWNQAREAGNYGWPYCVADNKAYRDYNFATSTSGSLFNCAAPVNDSPNNTGAQNLPAAQPAWIWYPYSPSNEFPSITTGGGRTAMAGPVYYTDPLLESKTKLPDYFDDTLFIYEWARNWIHEVKLNDDGSILDIQPFLSDFEFLRPIDMKLGPDGALYVIEWGTGFGGENEDSKVVRIEYAEGSRAPVIRASASPRAGLAPLTVQFDASDTFDPDPGENVAFAWDFDGDGNVDATDPAASFTYTENGSYTAVLTATDPLENSSSQRFQIIVGNSEPSIALTTPANGSFFDWGDTVSFTLSASDPEDGSTDDGGINCDDITLQWFIGHDDHTHPLEQAQGCEGTFVASGEDHGDESDRLFYVIEASYSDRSPSDVGSLTARAQNILQPRRIQAEHYVEQSGTQLETSQDERGGGVHLAFIDDGDYAAIGPINLQGIIAMTFRVASAGAGGRIAVRLGAPDGQEIGFANVSFTGGWQTFRDVTIPIENPGGEHTLFFVFENEPGVSNLFNVNWVEFLGTAPDGAEHGLEATYFNSINLTGAGASRTDALINYNWATGGPSLLQVNDNYSVRWTGFVTPEVSEAYQFYARSDDGMRVWLDGSQIINNWQNQAVTEIPSAVIQLEAGRAYPVVVEYYEAGGSAEAHLLWSSPSILKQPVPYRQLSPSVLATPQEPPTETPAALSIESLFPNPMRGSGSLFFGLPETSNVTVTLIDALGREVRTLQEGLYGAGRHEIVFDVSDLASGMYFCKLESEGALEMRRFVVVR